MGKNWLKHIFYQYRLFSNMCLENPFNTRNLLWCKLIVDTFQMPDVEQLKNLYSKVDFGSPTKHTTRLDCHLPLTLSRSQCFLSVWKSDCFSMDAYSQIRIVLFKWLQYPGFILGRNIFDKNYAISVRSVMVVAFLFIMPFLYTWTAHAYTGDISIKAAGYILLAFKVDTLQIT